MESGVAIVQDPPKIINLKHQNRDDSSSIAEGSSVFDASQYAFFGEELVEEVELGGLEDEDEDELLLSAAAASDFEPEEEEEEFLFRRRDGEAVTSLSDVDDLAATFAKLSRDVGISRSATVIDGRGFNQTPEWAKGEDFHNYQQQLNNLEINQGSQSRFLQQYSSSARLPELLPLRRTSTYPEQQQQQQQQRQWQQQQEHISSDPILVPRTTHTLYPPHGGQSPQASPNHGYFNIPYLNGNCQTSPNLSPFSSQLQLTGLQHGSQNFGGSLPQFASALSTNSRPPYQWAPQMDLRPGGHPNNMNDMLRLPHPNGLMPPKLIPQHHRLHHPIQTSLSDLSGMQAQLFNSHLSHSPPLTNKYECGSMFGLGGIRDQRMKPAPRVGQNLQYCQQGPETNGRKIDSAWPRFRSKYMNAEEIEGIMRMHLAATHGNDPYVDDYYNQGRLGKKSAGVRHHFCPSHLRDLPSRARGNMEPHAFLQVDALGRVPFSSIRRPRPLLEVDPPNSSITGASDEKAAEKPLEQEPLLVARVTIEDCLCLLLDVDDIDRFLEFHQLQDGGTQLRHRRLVLLEELAVSLQLVDPLGKNRHPKDDFVFLRLASLPKGQKLLARYIQLLLRSGGGLMVVVCIAIVRHLMFLFGNLPSDVEAAEIRNELARAVSLCVQHMDLRSLSACLAAVVCSSEQPPLRPLGSSAGNGASLILMSVLDRATELLNDASNHDVTNMSQWKASFDEFFGLLLKYCINKYDEIMQSSLLDPAEASMRELPVELLRASVPHTNAHQKKMLFDLSQRSLVGQ